MNVLVYFEAHCILKKHMKTMLKKYLNYAGTHGKSNCSRFIEVSIDFPFAAR